MKIWKQLVCVLLALTLLGALAACNQTPEETTPTQDTAATTQATEEVTEPTEETITEATEDMSVYSAFIGIWYEGGSDVANRLVIDEEKNWKYEDEAGELLMTGYYQLQEEDVLDLYNFDLELVSSVRLDGENGIYLEPCIDIAFELIQTNDFSKVITNSDSMDQDDLIEDIGDEPVVSDEEIA